MIDIEKSFERLEKINEEIRDPQLPLNKATQLFEEGIRLSKGIETAITKIEQKIEILMNPSDDTENEAKFDLFSEE